MSADSPDADLADDGDPSSGYGPRIDLPRRRLAIVTAGLLVSMMLSALDTSIVATAMPRIITELSGLEYYAWVTTAYLVTSTTVIPISGKLGDLFGRKRFVQYGIIGFLITSALCGLAQNMPELVAARAIQGIFGGFITSSVIASMADLYVPATRARMQGVFASVFATAAIAGPIIGGVLTDQLGWRWVFYVNIPIGIIASTIVALSMPSIRTQASRRHIDVRGSLLLALGLVPLLSALSLSREGVSSQLVLGLFLAAVAILVTFVWVELRAEHPVMPLSLFKTPTFRVGIVVSFLSAFGMFGSNIFIPLVYQGLLGLSATQSGALLTPRMVAMVCASLASGQIVTRIEHYRFVSAAGLASLATGLFVLSRVNTSSNEADVIVALILIGLGFGSNQPIYQNAVMSAVPHRYVGVASSQVQFWRSLGQTVGVAVLGAVLAAEIGGTALGVEPGNGRTAAAQAALATGLQHAFLVATVAVVVALVASLRLKEVPLRGRGSRATILASSPQQAAELGE
jgi:EmrB/QacA subfamily drug resistance transporter